MSDPTPHPTNAPYRTAPLRPEPPPARHPWRWSVGLSVIVALTRLGAQVTRPGTRLTTAATTPPPPPFHEHEAWIAGEAEDGAVAVVRGVQRIALRRGRSLAAPTDFAARLLSASRVAHGWVFVTADGTVASATSFLGRPRDLGRLPCAFRVDRVSRGLATAVDADGGLLVTDGSAPFARAAAPSPVRAAAFASPTLGAVILREGAVAVTRDAGRTWRAVDLHGDVAWAFARTREGIAVRGASARYVLDADGATPDAQGQEYHPPWPAEAQEPSAHRERGGEPFQSATRPSCPEAAPRTDAPAARRFLCHIGGEVRPSAPFADGECRSVDGERVDRDCASVRESRLHDSDGWVQVRRQMSANEVRRTVVGWRSVDARGAFFGRTAERVIQRPDADDEGPFAVNADEAIVVTRAGVVLRQADELLWAASGAWTSPIREPFLHAASDDGRVDRSLALALPGGGALLVLTQQIEQGSWRETWETRGEGSPWGFEESLGVAIELGPDGAVRTRRAMVFARPPLGVATDGRRHGVVVRRGEALVLLPLGDGAPTTLSTSSSIAVPLCGRAPPPGTPVWTLLRDMTYEDPPTLDPQDERDGQVDSPSFGTIASVRLELTSSGACLRGVRVGRDVESSVWLDATPDGRLEGVLDHAMRVTCRPAPPRAAD